MSELEIRVRGLSPAELAVVAGSVLEDLREDDPPATEQEIAAAVAADRQVVAAAVAELGVTSDEAPPSTDTAQVLLVLAEASPDATAAIEKALARLDQPQAKLPILGLGGLELIALAIAAAIARPNIEFSRSASGGTKLRVRLEGRGDLAKIIRAVLPSLGEGSPGG